MSAIVPPPIFVFVDAVINVMIVAALSVVDPPPIATVLSVDVEIAATTQTGACAFV